MFDPYAILRQNQPHNIPTESPSRSSSTTKSTTSSNLISKLQVLSLNRRQPEAKTAENNSTRASNDASLADNSQTQTPKPDNASSQKNKQKSKKRKKNHGAQSTNGNASSKRDAKHHHQSHPQKLKVSSLSHEERKRAASASTTTSAISASAPHSKKKRPKRTITGKSTHFCHWRRSNMIHIRLPHRNVDFDSLKQFLAEIKKMIRSKKQKPKMIKAIIELQENNLNDDAIKLLCTFIFQHHLHVSILKLWKNRLGDEAALAIAKLIHVMPMQEVHLSHNRISTVGAKAIFDAIHANKHYPIIISKNRKGQEHTIHEEEFLGEKHSADEDSQEGEPSHILDYTDRSTIMENFVVEVMPLWLRLEYNRIDAQEALEHLEHLQLSWCNAQNRNLCGPFHCAKKNIPHVHLYCFEHQYQNPELAPLLLETQDSVSRMRECLEKRILEDRGVKDIPQVKEEYDLAISREISTQLPLYIFVDTCSVLNMMGSGTAPSKKLNIAQRFCFKNLLRKAKLKQFGELGSRADSIHLILTDTIMQELDYHKNADQKGSFSTMIRQLTRDGGVFQKASHLNFLTLLGAHEAELLIKSEGREFFGQDGRSLVSNDLKLLQVALFWQEAIGVSGSVMVLTDDHEVHRRAKQHSLPAELLRTLDSNLTGFEDDPWTPQLLRQIIPHAFENHRGENLLEKAPMKTSFNSIYDEMKSAIELVERWMTLSREIGFDSRGVGQHSGGGGQEQQNTAPPETFGTPTLNPLLSRSWISEVDDEADGEDAEESTLTPLQKLLKDSEESMRNWKQLMSMRPALLK
mmetsp:Transcript_2953/g.11277  ORF Transcript_2953/g.11277 Transcript_2953/m.11277 type:complete len:803 (-) Transcript_2953:186-2594(-)